MLEHVAFQKGLTGPLNTKGQPYLTWVCGVQPEGIESIPSKTADEQSAWAYFWANFDAYLTEQAATVVEWRVPPTAEKYADGYAIRARFSILETANG